MSKNLSRRVSGITWMIFTWSFICLVQVFDKSLTQEFGLLGTKCKSNMTSYFRGLVLGEAILNTQRSVAVLDKYCGVDLQKHFAK